MTSEALIALITLTFLEIILGVDNVIFISILVDRLPREQREVARHKVFTAKTWNPPARAGDILLLRNDREAAALRLPLVK